MMPPAVVSDSVGNIFGRILGVAWHLVAINAKTCTALGSMGSICKCCQKHSDSWHISDTFRLLLKQKKRNRQASTSQNQLKGGILEG